MPKIHKKIPCSIKLALSCPKVLAFSYFLFSHGYNFSILMLARYADKIANAKWEVKELGLEHNGLVP